MVGVFSGPFMEPILNNTLQGIDFVSYPSTNSAYILLAVCGIVAGAIITFFGRKPYQKAVTAWPWLCLSLLTPLGAWLIAALLIIVFDGVITLLGYLIMILFVGSITLGLLGG